MALSTRGLAEGLQSGFQLGTNFFNTIQAGKDRAEQRRLAQYNIDRQAEQDALARQQFNKTMEKTDLEIQALRQAAGQQTKKLADKAEVDELTGLISGIANGTASIPENIDKIESKIDLSALVDMDLRQAVNAIASGNFDANNPKHLQAGQIMLGPKINDVIGNMGQDRTPIIGASFAGIDALDGENFVVNLNIVTEGGASYVAPITNLRSSDRNDTIKPFPIDMVAAKANGLAQLYNILDKRDVVQHLMSKRKEIAAPYTTKDGDYLFNELTKQYEYMKPTTPKNPTEASLAVLAAEGDQKAQAALDKLKELKAAEAGSEAEITRDTEVFKAKIKRLEDQARTAQDELAQLNEQIANLDTFERELTNLVAEGSGTGALAGYKSKALALAQAFGFSINERELATLQSIEAVNARLVLAGMGAIKGVASESDRMYVEMSTASLTNSVEANRRIIMYRKGELLKQSYAQAAIQNAATANYDDPNEGLRQQAMAQQLILNVPSTGVVVGPDGELRAMSLITFVEAKKRSTENFYGQSLTDQNKQMGMWFGEWARMTQEGLNRRQGMQ